jgi:hypothetical protein
MLSNPPDAAGAVQGTFVIASCRLAELRALLTTAARGLNAAEREVPLLAAAADLPRRGCRARCRGRSGGLLAVVWPERAYGAGRREDGSCCPAHGVIRRSDYVLRTAEAVNGSVGHTGGALIIRHGHPGHRGPVGPGAHHDDPGRLR